MTRDYAALPLLGGLVIALLLLSPVGLWKWRDEPFRVLLLTAFLGLGLATLHPYKEPRFLAVAAPFLMLLAALSLSRALYGRGQAPPARRLVVSFLCAGAIAGIGTVAARADLDARLAEDYKLYSARPAFWRPLAFLADRAAGRRRVAVIGTFNELSESLVRWRLATQGKTRGVEIVEPPARFDAGLPAEQVGERVRKWLDRRQPDRILAIRLLPSSRLFQWRDFQGFNAWQLAAIDSLENDPAWRIARRRTFKGIEVEILVIDRRQSVGDPIRAPGRRGGTRKPGWLPR